MSAWKAKRFWTSAAAEPCEGGFAVTLDGRAVKTPAKQPLILPTLAMAQAVAAEWDAQEGLIRPDTMPVTRAANSAIDKIGAQFAEVAELLIAYGDTDLLCYRAEGPEGLVARQAAGWDPLLDWAEAELQTPLAATAGVMHIPQPGGSLMRLGDLVRGFTAFELAAFHDLVAITGSLVLGLAVTRGRLGVEEAWTLSRIDESWQAEIWGEDEEAAILEAARRKALTEAGRFFGLCR